MKESFYFPHDNNAHNDPKLMQVFMKTGLCGIGLYWILIELMHQQESGKIRKPQYDDYIRWYSSHEKRGEEFVEQLLNIYISSELFCLDDDGFIYSKRVIENKKYREELSEKRSEAGKKSALARQKGTSVEQKGTSVEQGKERKGKEIKKKEIQKQVFISEYSENFQKKYEEWVEYRKQSKKKLTQITIDKQLAKCREWGESNSIKSIETSIERQWAGLFPYEDEQKKQQKHNGIDYEAEKKKTLEREKAANEAKRKEQEESDRKKREDDKILRWLDSLPESRKEQIEKEISENHMVTRLRMPPEDAPESEKESQKNIINSAKKMVRITLARKYYFQDNQ